MAEYQKNQKWQNILYSKGSLIALSVFLLLLIYSIFKTVPKNREAVRNRNIAMRQYQNLSSEAALLKAQVEKLKTADGVEESVRDKFRVIKEGEGLVVIVDEPKDEPKNENPDNKGLWSFLKGLFE